ncbi:NAD(P)/FAD-dependent oxidoreductase [Tepidibacter aestuarii]|uniref:NAD(P)/FAD-dependent oxidoreductase n=1 Tax=Tepidibacter aestuarii TaxID=2925782 RepID=UPI0020C16932|nr:FAD-dependent oxidoreductase [Tepidibacter aestuarii]CAH2212491.1 FAD binding domain protein [Tepidibacter aestuarii]
MQGYVKGKPIFTSINSTNNQYAYLTEDVETDVVIVGGGVTGSICSYYMSKNNIKSVLIEKGRIAHGSTSITTSLLQYELDENASELKEVIESKNIVRSYELGLCALKEIEKFVEEYGNKCDYIKRDTLLYTAKNLEKNSIKEEYKFRKENGFNVEYIDELDNPYGFDLKAGLLSKEGGAEIDPYKFTNHLLEVSIKKGALVYENTEAKKIEYLDKGVIIYTSYGYKVKAKKVIVATGYNTSLFTNKNFGTKNNTFNIATKPVKEIRGWKEGVLIRDNSDPYNYLRTTKDNRLIIGGEDVDFKEIENEDIAFEKYSILEQRLKSMFKYIDDIEIEYKYCGCIESTKDNLGYIGPDKKHENLWYCLGYGGNGILFAILGGIMLSKLYHEEKDEDMRLFKVNRFDN